MNIKVGQILERATGKGTAKVLGVINDNLFMMSELDRHDRCYGGYALEELKENFILPRTKWVPEKREAYWCFDSQGHFLYSIWDGYFTDTKRLEFGNVFSTKELAQEASEKIKKLLSEMN